MHWIFLTWSSRLLSNSKHVIMLTSIWYLEEFHREESRSKSHVYFIIKFNSEINIVQFIFTWCVPYSLEQKLSLHKKVEQLRNLLANTCFQKKGDLPNKSTITQRVIVHGSAYSNKNWQLSPLISFYCRNSNHFYFFEFLHYLG